MSSNNRQLRIFIASPSDCDCEKEIAKRVCQNDPSIKAICREYHISVDAISGKDVCPDMGRPQSLINREIEKHNPDWFVFIFWHSFGSDAGSGMTGIEEEWNLARALWEKGNGYPRVSVYFNKTDEWQSGDLRIFQEKIFKEYQALACFFNGPEDFKEKWRGHLTEHLLVFTKGRSGVTIEGLESELLSVSDVLLNYPRTLGKGQYIKRPELCEIIQRITESPFSTSIILGDPGSGKSSLLSTLAHFLNDNSVPVLAIKADTLPTDVTTAEGLQKALGLSLGVQDGLLALAEKEKVVLIVDQIDAISELSDRKSGRLNVLLNLIQTLSGCNGVHIVASSRVFEFYNDVRLNNINAERTMLELPAWREISPILELAGHQVENASMTLKELLRTPLHLKIFLDIAEPGETYSTLHALLEELWKQKVLMPEAPERCLELLDKLTGLMSDDECLWLPAACADEYPEELHFLERNGILQRDGTGATIGFRHQTYYDFALARAFARGSASLSNYVFERENGLFVRPTFVNGLQYLRATRIQEYHKQINIFFKDRLRPHLFSLLIEFLGSQKQPDDIEAYLLFYLLNSVIEGPKVLKAITGNPGWFDRLYKHGALIEWMKKAPEHARHCVPLLAAATSFSGMLVFDLVKRYWLSDETYDSLTLGVLLDFREWDNSSVAVAEMLVRRSNDNWTTEMLVRSIAGISPELTPSILRAKLDNMLDKEIQKIEEQVVISTSSEKDEEHIGKHLVYAPLKKLLEEPIYYIDTTRLAVKVPYLFIQAIWPWFLHLVNLIAYEEHGFVMQYRSDPVLTSLLNRDKKTTIVIGLFAAIRELAKTDLHGFIGFFEENMGSDLLIVHRILACGLEQIASIEPSIVMNYLLGDPRRMSVGDCHDRHRETKQLISSVLPYCGQDERVRLEEAVKNIKIYKKVMPEWTTEDRFKRLKWTRQHRLQLLRVFPEKYLSQEIKRLRMEEERAFPLLVVHDKVFSGGLIGPRLNAKEMYRASDQDLFNLFEQLSDDTQWDHPRQLELGDLSRGGGSIQQSREYKNFAKDYPMRAVQLLANLQPGRHESYAGAAIEGLAESEERPDTIIDLVENFDKQGFDSGVFRERASSALEVLAGRSNGLSDRALSLLLRWLSEQKEPSRPDYNGADNEKGEDTKGSILFGTGSTVLPSGRGTILRAIIAGLLKRKPPTSVAWANVIESRLGCEKHPDIWALTMMHMHILFNGRSEEATSIFDAVIQTCPQVLRKKEALYAIARVMDACRPLKVLQGWLEKIYAGSLAFSRQAFGEMIFLYHCHHKDSWSTRYIMEALSKKDDMNILLGLAYGASRLWHELGDQSMAREVLCRLADQTDEHIQQAVAGVFLCNRGYFQITTDAKAVINAICDNYQVLLIAAPALVELLVDYTGTEPALVSDVCQKVICAGGSDIGNISTSLALLAETLTSIALTLHRNSEYREVGLEMFEKLLSLNVRETRAALDMLDRKPYTTHHYII